MNRSKPQITPIPRITGILPPAAPAARETQVHREEFLIRKNRNPGNLRVLGFSRPGGRVVKNASAAGGKRLYKISPSIRDSCPIRSGPPPPPPFAAPGKRTTFFLFLMPNTPLV